MTLAQVNQYIRYIMKKTTRPKPVRRLLITSLLLTLVWSGLAAGIPVRDAFGLSADIGWYGSIPSQFHDDPLPVRSHLTFGGTVTPATFGIGENLELSAGIAAYYTTRSLIYGTTVWRPFAALGATIDLTFHLDPRFSITPAITMMAGMYTQTREIAPILRLSVTGGYDLLSSPKRQRWILTVPVSIDLRTDYVAVTAGIGMKWKLDRKIPGGAP
ncbi:MAG: hypothetical protein CVV46_12345 [Spirochaetae bacterium HGW-Spirochaetae-2]|nr:MAG: hypothetical protein CVV46_12345 [Spirochaetae bacterium HGW-Spirochaetae-2]